MTPAVSIPSTNRANHGKFGGFMSLNTDLNPAGRKLLAQCALDGLGSNRDNRTLLRVRCGRSHHVAAVIDTDAGPVFESRVGPHAHGDRDFVDTAHHGGRRGSRYIDLLDGDRFADDLVPAYCECGGHQLSRAQMQRAIATHDRTILLT